MKHSKTSLFLMELIISILFFSLASAVCVRLFVKSHQISTHSVALNHSVRWCENIAELLQAYHGDIETVCQLLESAENCSITGAEVPDSFSICFDKDWLPIIATDRANIYYVLSVSAMEASIPSTNDTNPQGGTAKTFHIAMQSLHDMKPIDSSLPVIYELDTIVYQQLTLTSDGKVVQHAD